MKKILIPLTIIFFSCGDKETEKTIFGTWEMETHSYERYNDEMELVYDYKYTNKDFQGTLTLNKNKTFVWETIDEKNINPWSAGWPAETFPNGNFKYDKDKELISLKNDKLFEREFNYKLVDNDLSINDRWEDDEGRTKILEIVFNRL